MKKILLYSLFISLLFNCSSRDEDVVEEVPVLPVKLTYDFVTPDNIFSSIFTYKNNNEIVDITTTIRDNIVYAKEVYTYNKDNIIKIEYYEWNKLTSISEFSYNNNRVAKNIITYDDGRKIHYEYNWVTANHLVVVKKETEPHENLDYYFSDGNLVKYIYKYNSNPYDNFGGSTFSYEYDNSPNVYSNIKGFDKINFLTHFFSKNNISKKTEIITNTTNGYTTTKAAYDDFSYDYYSNGYPKKQTGTSTNQQGQTTTSLREYQYNK
ncbi:hypothetical protein [Epilithonimonas hungarica]|uniref:Uncharacterized protein n=1 Tax=Epilithonimonas hungarica TaxID=454006 RepID=A0A1G7PYX1_9FLAO|nr:hypothetical protein [Epilithonimonas hungarica]SDF91464.1 hypothetical protein SAMN05421825_2460 [Epilithonimonas hungarica]